MVSISPISGILRLCSEHFNCLQFRQAHLDGTILPPDNPFWVTYSFSLPFIREDDFQKLQLRKPKDIPPVPEGFAGSPLDSWWKLADSTAERIVKYGLKEEV